jgi:hypothetical protein
MHFTEPRRNLIRPTVLRPRRLRSYEQIILRLRQGKRCIERRRQMIHDSEWRMPAGPGQPLSPGPAGTMEGPGRAL